MCVVVAPVVMMGIMAATTVAATAMSVMAAQQQGQASAAAAGYNAQVARNNQLIAGQNVEATNAAEVVAEQNSRARGAALQGRVRAELAGSGIDPNFDAGPGGSSALNLQRDAAIAGEADALTIRSNYARKAYDYEVAGMTAGAQAQLDDAQGRFARTGADLQSFSTILTGASSLSSKWMTFSQLGGGGASGAKLGGPSGVGAG